MSGVSQKTVDTWWKSKVIIMGFLREIRPDYNMEQLENNAGVIIARLAQAEPPLLICTPAEMKE